VKRSHPLWAQNNRHRAFWGEPPSPEPEQGFAPEARPEGWEEVAQWFTEAAGGGPRRYWLPRMPSPEAIDGIARVINEFSNLSCPPPETQAAIELGHRLQKATDELKPVLGAYLDMAQLLPQNRPSFVGPSQTRLIDFWNALVLAEPEIGPPPRQGPQAPWNYMARALHGPVAEALMSAGRTTVSIKADTLLVKIIQKALKAIDGVDRKNETITSCLRVGLKIGSRVE
jgi:hypothetical protein